MTVIGHPVDRMRSKFLFSAVLLAVTGCSGERVVNTGEWETILQPSTTVSPPLPPIDSAHLANAFDFAQNPNGQTAYYFSTPSGRWQCAILPRDMAGCQGTGGGLSVGGAPDTVATASGEQATPNAVVIGPQGDGHFAALDAGAFSPPSPATVLPLNRTLIVARFRCNVQEATGVSCLSEDSGAGFTFSADGFLPQYAEVPLDAP